MHEMFEQTDTRWAPWKVIDGNNKKAARIAALTHVAEALEAAVPMTPPDRDPALVELASEAFGYKRSEEHTSELQSLMRISYAVFCLKKKKNNSQTTKTTRNK